MSGCSPVVLRAAAGTLLLWTAGTLAARAQVTPPPQRTLAQELLSTNQATRNDAFAVASRIAPQERGPELRAALIALLEQLNALVRRLEQRQVPVDTAEDPEFIRSVQREVVALKDPATIQALADSLGNQVAVNALAQFAEQAAPSVIRVVIDPKRHYSEVSDGLRILRFMIERQDEYPLADETRAQITRAARQRLSGEQSLTVLYNAIDLAAVLNDSELRQMLEGIAAFQEDVFVRGVTDPKLVQMIQQQAAARLAGTQALPRPRY